MIAIINATPLIYLGKIGALKYIPQLFNTCVTSEIVKLEVLADKNAPEIPLLRESFENWLKIRDFQDKKL